MTDSDIKRLRPQVIALGSLYRLLSDHLGMSLSDPLFQSACMYPYRVYGQLILRVAQNRTMTSDLQDKIQSLSDFLDLDDMSNFSDVCLPSSLQGEFFIGYYAGYKTKKGKSLFCLFRKQSGLTQSQLADKLGVSQVAVARWETGKASPSEENLQKLCDILDCTRDDLLST